MASNCDNDDARQHATIRGEFVGDLSTALGKNAGSYDRRPGMLNIPPDASRVAVTFASENIQVVIAPASDSVLSEAMALERAHLVYRRP